MVRGPIFPLDLLLLSLLAWILTACLIPPAAAEYSLFSLETTISGFVGVLNLVNPKMAENGPDISQLRFMVDFQTASRLQVKISDVTGSRWQVPGVSNVTETTVPPHSRKFAFSFTENPFGFSIVRTSAVADTIFDTKVARKPNIVFKDNYLEISTKISNSSHIFGFGERSQYFELDQSKSYTLWALDNYGVPVAQNLYGSHPFFLNYKQSEGNKPTTASGIFLLNSNGMEISFSEGVMTYKILGGVLDFYVFLGPTPEQVVQQYLEVIGRPFMIPYWALGYHQSRWGYKNLAEVKEVVGRFSSEKIPLETVWTDIDVMDQFQDFTFDPVNFPAEEVRKFVQDLHSKGQYYIPIVDSGIGVNANNPTYTRGIQRDVFVKNVGHSGYYQGEVWPGPVHYPDFLHPNATSFWTEEISLMYQSVPVDGLWIDMNEPSNFATDPPFVSTSFQINNGGAFHPLNWKTIPMDAQHFTTTHYNFHNLYGHNEAAATNQALTEVRGKRGLVISRSTFPGSGRYAGHWLGDNRSTWQDLKNSIPGVFNFNLFGIPLVGADICGFIGNTTEELCARWMQLGAFYPFARNHNERDANRQEPYQWPKVQSAAKASLQTRYLLLPYYYHLFFRAHTSGSMVIKPLFFDFPDQHPGHVPLWAQTEQLLIGDALLLSPVLSEGASKVSAFLPEGPRWYDFHQGVESPEHGWVTLPASYDFVNLHIRGGSIVPTQKPELTTKRSRANPLSLVIALNSAQSASGSLYWDDGESLDSVSGNKHFLLDLSFHINSTHCNLQARLVNKVDNPGFFVPILDSVTIFGLPYTVYNISGAANGDAVVTLYNPTTKVLKVSELGLDITAEFTLALSRSVVTPEQPKPEEFPYLGAIIIVIVAALILVVSCVVLHFRKPIRDFFESKFGRRGLRVADEDEVETYFPSGERETENPTFRHELLDNQEEDEE